MNGPHYPCVRFGCETLVPATAYVCHHHMHVDPPNDNETDDGEHLALNTATLKLEGQPHARGAAA